MYARLESDGGLLKEMLTNPECHKKMLSAKLGAKFYCDAFF